MARIVPMGDFSFPPTPMGTTVCLCLAMERAGLFSKQASQPAAHWIHTASLKKPACVRAPPPSSGSHVFVMLQSQGLCLTLLFVPSVLQIDA